jgi:very-short-patch-repair endonuclease
MENYLIIGVIIFAAIIVLGIKTSSSSEKRKVFKNNVYNYTAKQLLMSKSEAQFFIRLEQSVSERYYVFPQVHLSALLDHKVKGQDWHYSFRHINGKSVDYVLCDRETLRPTYAIELDDITHERKDRRERDAEVQRIFEEAHLPLVRFANKDVSEGEIIQALAKARSLMNSQLPS